MGKSKNTIHFEHADKSHIGQIHEIEQAVFPVPWSYDSLLQDICEHEISVYIVGICDGCVVSYAGFWYVMEEAHITNIAVKEDYRERGIGSSMMQVLCDTAADMGVKTMTLEVRESNMKAIRMYEKIGFSKVGRRKRYYSDNFEDAIVMNNHL